MWWKNFIIQLKINLLGHSSSTAVVQYCNIYAEEQWISLQSSSSCTLSIWMTIGTYSKDFYAIVLDNAKRVNCIEREREKEQLLMWDEIENAMPSTNLLKTMNCKTTCY